MKEQTVQRALDQIHDLELAMLEGRRFRGFSGRARALAGVAALLAACVMSAPGYPQTPRAHVAGWGAVFAIAVLLNSGALIRWFFTDPQTKGDWRHLIPAAGPFPSLFVGGVLTAALILEGQHHFLFGVWMSLHGVSHLAVASSALPRANRIIGMSYVLAGSVCLLSPGLSFLNPWPMGLVFFIGESIGGFVFHRFRTPEATLTEFLGIGTKGEPQS